MARFLHLRYVAMILAFRIPNLPWSFFFFFFLLLFLYTLFHYRFFSSWFPI